MINVPIITREKVSSLMVSGISVRTRNIDEFEPTTAKLPQHWQRFFIEGIAARIPHCIPNSSVYGVYCNYESDVTGHYDLLTGVAVTRKSELFGAIEIDQGNYLVFSATGTLPEVLISTWQFIWSFFTENPDIKRKYTTDFEVYSEPNKISVYVAIE